MPTAVGEHLDEHRDITLFCRDEHGTPVGYPMTSITRSDTEMFFSTYRKSAKVRHLEHDPRVALLSLRPEGDHAARWVSMTGRATIWSPTEPEMDALFGARPNEPRVPDTMSDLVRQRTLEGKRILLRIAIDAPDRLAVLEATR